MGNAIEPSELDFYGRPQASRTLSRPRDASVRQFQCDSENLARLGRPNAPRQGSYVLEQKSQENARNEARHAGECEIQSEARPRVPHGWHGSVQYLNGREIPSLIYPSVLNLLGEQRDQRL